MPNLVYLLLSLLIQQYLNRYSAGLWQVKLICQQLLFVQIRLNASKSTPESNQPGFHTFLVPVVIR